MLTNPIPSHREFQAGQFGRIPRFAYHVAGNGVPYGGISRATPSRLRVRMIFFRRIANRLIGRLGPVRAGSYEMIFLRTAYRISSGTLCKFNFSIMLLRCVSTV